MKFINYVRLSRWLLTIVLIVGVFFETGPFTSLSILLIFFAFELQSLLRHVEHKRQYNNQTDIQKGE